MNENINLVEILRDCREGMQLYSPIYGNVKLLEVVKERNYPISVTLVTGKLVQFSSSGRITELYPQAECTLFPSKEQRDWRKFWKKGDLLTKDDAPDEIFRFDGYQDETYMKFKIYSMKLDGERLIFTFHGTDLTPWKLASEDYIKEFFAKLDELPSKVENVEYVPKSLDQENKSVQHFNPYDMVLVRDYDYERWSCGLFSHLVNDEYYICLNGVARYQCIRYEGNEHLLGTAKNP